ncbi:AAA family ATPase [Streptomyces sp. AC627_RSS907]|uniref:AAA family ATPase n=1 Tax=Streptomyces sp. AC627_RSS907 TaxID=2823684 RepID=UPI001C22E9FE|nr:AAA family ATPase [Streptomyces sp. AC627_RSS907]
MALGRFLRDQSQAACLSARDIEQRFQYRAHQERARIEAGQEPPVDPVSDMKFSKSHLDRLFKGTASLPSKRFVKVFLEITSSAASIRPELHRELCCVADELLTAAHQYRQKRRSIKSPASTTQGPTEVAVATLQAQLELERAHRTEDRLRWALSDAQLLMTTLLQIISTLRDIVIDIDTEHLQVLRSSAESATLDVTANQRLQALRHKATAEDQLARVNERRALLETLWEQAHDNVHRLSLHPDVTEVKSLPVGPALPQQELLPTAALAQPALADIAAALGKAQEINNTEERKTRELQQYIRSDTHTSPVDELATLLAATQLTDAPSRETALRALIRSWSRNPKTRDALARMTVDDQPDIRAIAVLNLARTWSEDPVARQALIAVTRDRELKVRTIAVWGLAQAWADDPDALDALVFLTQDRSAEARAIAVEGLAEGWPENPFARNAVLSLLQDAVQRVREIAIEVLLENWSGDVITRDALLALLRAKDVSIREVAVNGLSIGWPSDTSVTNALLTMRDDPAPTVQWAVERSLARKGLVEATGNEYPVAVSDPRSADTAPLRQEVASRENGSLIAVRVPHDYSMENPPSGIATLRRGINFSSGINVIHGDNGTGKTLLLKALAIQLGAVRGRRLHQTLNQSKWARYLAEHLEVLLGEGFAPEDCFYTGPANSSRHARRNQLSIALDEPSKYRLYLLDEPTGSYDYGAISSLYKKMNHLSRQGCQFIIVTNAFARPRPDVPPEAKVIQLGDRRLRDRMAALGW